VDNLKRDVLTTPVILRIALDTPLRRLFDYLPARDSTVKWNPACACACLSAVSAGGRGALGGHDVRAATRKTQAVLEVIDADPVIDAQVMQLLEWAAQYYHHPLGS
jgi:primosomal protein N' (replication factor Y)